MALAGALAGCGSDEITQAEIDAIEKLRGTRVQLHSAQGRVNRIEFVDRTVTAGDLQTAAQCARLDTLILAKAKFDDAALAHLADMPRLANLSLKGSSVTDAGLDHVANVSTLRELDLEGTAITDAGLEKLKGMKRLRSVYLGGTKVTANGLRSLKEALPSLRID